ncbi:hypothetical protein C8R43DRAFT_1036130 [Mycena crocata]|nr:hypothetical protein C8R43DRAFT_1036130 [Mycena crocata]
MSEIEVVAAECNPGARQHSRGGYTPARPMPYSPLHPLPSDEGFLNKSLLDQLDAQADAEPVESAASDDSDHSSPHVPYHQPHHTDLHSQVQQQQQQQQQQQPTADGALTPSSLFSGNPTLSIPSGPNALPPRKQIIGFAKFRTREEALGLHPAEPLRQRNHVPPLAPRAPCPEMPAPPVVPASCPECAPTPSSLVNGRTDECECDSARSRCPGAATSPLTSHVRRLATLRPSH